MNIYFTRHGETDWNKKNKILGVTDIELNETGVNQARALAEKIRKEIKISIIYSSPLKRAVKTANCIGQAVPCEIIIDERLREWDYGEYEGHHRDYNGFQQAKTEFGVRMGASGESLMQLSHRVFSCLDDIIETQSHENVLIVSHGGVARVVEMYFGNLTVSEYRNLFMKNCEIRRFEV